MKPRKRGGRKRKERPRFRKKELPFNVRITQALAKLQRNQKLVFRNLKEEVAFENIRRIALGDQIGRLGEEEWGIVRNVLLRNQRKMTR